MAKKRETTAKDKAKSAKKSASKKNAAPREQKSFALSKGTVATLASVLAAVLIALSIRTFGFSLVLVRSDAMNDTLQAGDIVLIARSARPETGNIVLAGAMNGSALRRVAGEPGDTVSVKNGQVTRNSMPLHEPYIVGEAQWDIPETTLQAGVYLLLPDNRVYDSALVESGGIAGVVRAVVWPFSRAGFF